MTPSDIISKIFSTYYLVENGKLFDVFMVNYYNTDPQLLCTFDNEYDAETFRQKLELVDKKYSEFLLHYFEDLSRDEGSEYRLTKNLYHADTTVDGKGVVIKNGNPFVVVRNLDYTYNVIKNLQAIDVSYDELSKSIQDDLREYWKKKCEAAQSEERAYQQAMWILFTLFALIAIILINNWIRMS